MAPPPLVTRGSDAHRLPDARADSRGCRCACGFNSPAAARFCGGCGSRLKVASAFLLAATPDRPAQLHTAHCGELRHATVLFADIVDSTEQIAQLDAAQARNRLQPAITLMCEVVERFGGTVMRTLGDGVMALFGAPAELEEHARLACGAALHMQAEFAQAAWGLCIRVGLHSGPVACDPLPHDGRKGGLAHGLTIHLASRVQGLASPRCVAMTHDCHSLVTGLVEVEPMGPRSLKGVPDAVEIFRLTGLKDGLAS